MEKILIKRKESSFILSKEIIEYGDEALDKMNISVELVVDYNNLGFSISRHYPNILGTKYERGFFFEGTPSHRVEECLALTELLAEAIKLSKKELKGE